VGLCSAAPALSSTLSGEKASATPRHRLGSSSLHRPWPLPWPSELLGQVGACRLSTRAFCPTARAAAPLIEGLKMHAGRPISHLCLAASQSAIGGFAASCWLSLDDFSYRFSVPVGEGADLALASHTTVRWPGQPTLPREPRRRCSGSSRSQSPAWWILAGSFSIQQPGSHSVALHGGSARLCSGGSRRRWGIASWAIWSAARTDELERRRALAWRPVGGAKGIIHINSRPAAAMLGRAEGRDLSSLPQRRSHVSSHRARQRHRPSA